MIFFYKCILNYMHHTSSSIKMNYALQFSDYDLILCFNILCRRVYQNSLITLFSKKNSSPLLYPHSYDQFCYLHVHIKFWSLQNLKGKLFGGKDSKENLGYSMPHQYRELEELLAQERLTNKQISEQLAKTRAELVALRGNDGWCSDRDCVVL